MAHYILDESLVIDAVTAKFQAVKAAGTAHATPVTGTGDLVLGVCQEAVVTADIGKRVVAVRTKGVTVAIAGAAIATVGTELKVTAAGRFIPVTTAGDIIAGRSRTVAAADGDWFEMDLYPSNKHA
jgi:hypothetical protein